MKEFATYRPTLKLIKDATEDKRKVTLRTNSG